MVTERGWTVALTGYVQADAVPWSEDSVDEIDPSTSAPLNQERLSIPRARLRATARRDDAFALLELDGNTQRAATARLLAAQVGWSRALADDAQVTVAAGLMKIPFGAEVPADERDKPFVEAPAISRALFPGNYDAGVVVRGSYGVARWAVAAMNGAPVGDAQWKGLDPSSSYDFVGRIGAEIDGPRKLHISAGASALTGTGLHPGTPPTKDGLQWVDQNQNGRVDPTELEVIPGSAGEPSQTFARRALGVDATVQWCLCALGTGAAFFEAAIATNLDRGLVYADPIATSRDLRQLGFAAGAVQSIGAYAVVGARYDRYDADRDAMDRQGVDLVNVHKVFSTLAIMASARWADARVTVEYDHQRNPFGRGDDGAPTTRAADRITLRAQVGF